MAGTSTAIWGKSSRSEMSISALELEAVAAQIQEGLRRTLEEA
jgi:hypothetical protein